MTEVLSPPRNAEDASARQIKGAPEAVQLNSLDALVGFKKSLHEDFEENKTDTSFEDYYEQKLVEVLAAKGIADDEKNIAQHAEYEYLKSIYQLVSELDSDEDWKLVSMDDPARTEIPRSVMYKMLKDHYNANSSVFVDLTEQQPSSSEEVSAEEKHEPADVTTQHQHDDVDHDHDVEQGSYTEATRENALDRARRDLKFQREQLASITAKRQGKAVSFRKKAFENARDSYNEQLHKLGKLELADILDDESTSENDKHTAVIAFIFEEQAKLRELTTNVLTNTKVGRFVEFMNRGNTFTRILKGAGVGVAAGIGGALVVGSGLAGAGVIAGSAVAAGRFSRGFARSDARRGRGMAVELGDEDDRGILRNVLVESEEDSLEEAIWKADEWFVDDTKAEQRKRRKSVAAGVGGIALGGLLGAGIHAASELPSLIDKDQSVPSGETPPVPDMDGDGIPDVEDRDRDGDGVRNGNDAAPNNPNISETISTRNELFDGRLGTRELTPEGREALAEQLDGYHVKPGDSVWSLSEQFLHEQGVDNPTTYEIDATKDVLLKELQASGNADSRGWLTAGDTINIK